MLSVARIHGTLDGFKKVFLSNIAKYVLEFACIPNFHWRFIVIQNGVYNGVKVGLVLVDFLNVHNVVICSLDYLMAMQSMTR